jgi:hypothetical protein
MPAIRVEIHVFTDESQPGWVECNFADALGRVHMFGEKVPIVTAEMLDSRSGYPRDGAIRCTIVDRQAGPDGREIVTVDTQSPDSVESKEGKSRFVVFRDQLLHDGRDI